MATISGRLHIICGFCGSRNDFKLRINTDEELSASLSCNNCSVLSDIGEELDNTY